MAQTPLHVSSGYNNVEIVKFLLNWQGPEKVELEAKNMVGKMFCFVFCLFIICGGSRPLVHSLLLIHGC